MPYKATDSMKNGKLGHQEAPATGTELSERVAQNIETIAHLHTEAEGKRMPVKPMRGKKLWTGARRAMNLSGRRAWREPHYFRCL